MDEKHHGSVRLKHLNSACLNTTKSEIARQHLAPEEMLSQMHKATYESSSKTLQSNLITQLDPATHCQQGRKLEK